MGNRPLDFNPITKARLRPMLIKSRPILCAIFFFRLLSGFYLRLTLHCTAIRISNPHKMLAAWRDFQEGRTRLILAFRHPYSAEPQILFHAFSKTLTCEARKAGKKLPRVPHARFVHGYEVALWGDAIIRWVLPRIGAVPVYHTKLDSKGLKAIRSIISEGLYPLAIAPEGQVSYRSETVPRLEQGTLQMGFWGVQDIENAGRTEKVIILPLSIHYKYDPRDHKKLLPLLGSLELRCGIDPVAARKLELRERLAAIENRAFELAEGHYAAAYAYKRPDFADQYADEKTITAFRRDSLLNAALEIAERALGFPAGQSSAAEAHAPRSDLISRVYKIRAECWDRIYPEKAQKGLSKLETALSDRRAGEAWYAMRHMEFADIAFYLDPEYLDGPDRTGPSLNRIAECANNLADLMNRLAGGTIADRRDSLRKIAIIVPGVPLDMSSRWGDYRENRKKAVLTATADLKTSFENCIKEYLDEIS